MLPPVGIELITKLAITGLEVKCLSSCVNLLCLAILRISDHYTCNVMLY